MAVAGYNIALKLDTDQCTLAGRTQDDLTIAARTKESLTKDDSGSPQVAVVGHDASGNQLRLRYSTKGFHFSLSTQIS